MSNKINWQTLKEYEDITFKMANGVARIAFNRPEVRNAFREQTLDEMREAVLQTKEDVTISCIVFTGAGDEAFSAGGDFYAMKRLNWGYVMNELNPKIISEWIDQPPSNPVSYPDTAQSIVEWINSKSFNNIDKLSLNLWKQVSGREI